ncbi:hypothetical protein [Cereibacter sphaeroides]|nr:hypothetical protein [Cereibacter sphaeroides]MCE6972023.1 hypothetical protein [Cereibacter sphaeroides]
MLDLIRAYIADNREALAQDPDKLAIVKRLVAKQTAEDRFIAADPKLSQAFVRIDRVFPGAPVSLFGQEVPSLAHNRISIHLGMDDPETGERVPGKSLLTVLLSEEALSNLMMNQNRGSTATWMTAESALGWPLGPFRAEAAGNPEHELSDRIAHLADAAMERLAALRQKAARNRLPWTKAAQDDLLRNLDLGRDARDVEFHLGRHLEVLQQRQVQAQVEAAHTALHIDSVLEARDRLLLAPPDRIERDATEFAAERLANPMLDALIENRDEAERALLLEIVWHGLRRFLEAQGLEHPGTEFPGENGLAASLRMARASSEAIEEARNLCRLHVDLTNEHRQATRDGRSPWMLTGGISAVSGWQQGFHSDFSRQGSHFFTLTIEAAAPLEEHGLHRLRAFCEVVSLHLTAEDLMTVLRGHPSGGFTRCTLEHVFGRRIETAPYENRFDKRIGATATSDEGKLDAAQKEAMARVRNCVAAGIRTADDRSQLVEALDALALVHETSLKRRAAEARAAGADLSAMVEEDIRGALETVMSQVTDRNGGKDRIDFRP